MLRGLGGGAKGQGGIFMGLLTNRNSDEGGLTEVLSSALHVSHPFSGTVAGPGIIFMVIAEGQKKELHHRVSSSAYIPLAQAVLRLKPE